jgi:hypothetical protein
MALKVSGRKLQALRDAKTRNTSITWKDLLLSEVLGEVDVFGGRVFPGARFFENGNAVGEEGRFTSEDPARDGINWYAYCNNNPMRYVDPTGFDEENPGKTDSKAPAVPGIVIQQWNTDIINAHQARLQAASKQDAAIDELTSAPLTLLAPVMQFA